MNKVTTYTNDDFIDSTITLSEIDTKGDVWEKIQTIKSEYDEFGFTDDYEWRVYVGNLHIDHTFILNGDLIVTGNLIIKGDYLDGCDSTGLVVLGDMTAENIISHDFIYVKGSVNAQGLIYCYYNHSTGEFCSKIHAQLFCIDDRDFRISGEVLCHLRGGVMCHLGYEDELSKKDIEPFVDEIFHIEEYEEGEFEIHFDDDLIREYLTQGKSLYK